MSRSQFGTVGTRALRMLLMLAAVVAVCLLAPARALAREYEIVSVDITAEVGADGSLVVQEAREFAFDGSFHGVYWKIPTGRYKGREIETSVIAVGEIVDGTFVPFTRSTSGDEHTYELDEYSSYVRVKLYSSHANEHAVFGISYRDANLVSRHADVGELYWKFVSDGWDVESQNVTCTVKLPVPDGSGVWPTENVYAWGHGPLDAALAFEGNDVVYRVPGVGTSEFAEARIAFPESWVSGAESDSETALPDILAEEQAWADEANAKRTRARILTGGVTFLTLAAPLASIVLTITKWSGYKRAHKPQFDDKYFRDVPSADHPAVLGALLNGGDAPDECMTAALMRLTDLGYAQLERVTTTKKGAFGHEKKEEDYRLTPLRWPERDTAASSLERIDHETMELLFSKLAPLAVSETGDRDRLYFGSLKAVAKRRPESYDSYYKSWQSDIRRACDERGFFTDSYKSGMGGVIGLGILCVFAAVGSVFATVGLGLHPVVAVLGMTLGIGGFVGALLASIGMKSLSTEAVELQAKLKALRNWLKDFTRLEEAVPQDVILWNRLLVMAVVLGVADEVIKQLKMVAPQVLESAAVANSYAWCNHYGTQSHSPASSFTDSFGKAHSVSAAELSDSSSSSGGGGGGGFSSGGGGGFGGGGGGGAF